MSSGAGSSEERKVATVLFADLVGSTAAASGEDPERVRLRLERFYEAMAEEIDAAGGTVEKFAGDAVMAVFGAPAALEDHAERALHAALAMQRRLHELFGDETALRIGVNTGEVFVGSQHEGSSFVAGDAVNVAARLEQAAAPGETLVGRTDGGGSARRVRVLRAADGGGEGEGGRRRLPPAGPRALADAAARGGRLPLRLRRPRAGAGPAASGHTDRVVSTGAPGLVTIVGDAGVGKTRLVRELWQWLAGQEPRAAPAHRPVSPVRRRSPTGRSARCSRSSSASARRLPRERARAGSETARCSGSRSGSTSPATCTR